LCSTSQVTVQGNLFPWKRVVKRWIRLSSDDMATPTVSSHRDHLDLIVAQWSSVWPEVHTKSMAVIGRILRVALHLQREIERELAQFDLALPEFNLLAALRRSTPPRVSPAELSRLLIISSGGVAKQIDRLERDGLVKRIPHPTDGRGLLVELTPAGRRLFDKAMRAHIANEQRLLSTLEEAQHEQLSNTLRSLLIGLEGTNPAAGGKRTHP
jgi:DNA-binding MarR family transcriptional regulator